MNFWGMDIIGIGCSVVRSSLLEFFMGPFGYLGHGFTGTMIGLVLITYGYFSDNRKIKRAGLAVLLSIAIAGVSVNILKVLLQMPRPIPTASYGFPSGHASTAFGMAAALGMTFPKLIPLFYLLAVLTGISRLYFRAHFVWDVIGGALIGILVGTLITKWLINPSKTKNKNWVTTLGWSATAFATLTALVFFLSFERSLRVHRVSTFDPPDSSGTPVMVDFGTPDARRFLGYGWSSDEKWIVGTLSVVWAKGSASALSVPFPVSENYRVRLRLYPFAPIGPSCQRVEVTVNRVSIARLHLERGWHNYEIDVPKSAIRAGNNEIQFSFDYAQSPKSRGINPDERPLSAAFDLVEFIPEN